MKKIIALLLAALMVFSMAACGETNTATDAKDIKIGMICLHDENSTYDLNFLNGMYEAIENLGLDAEKNLVIKKNIPESSECYEAAADLADQGCDLRGPLSGRHRCRYEAQRDDRIR